mgnify:CR=1 FL=1
MLQSSVMRLVLIGMLAVMGLAQMAGAAEKAKERVVIQVSDGDPKTWNQALNVVKNIQEVYGKDKVRVEVVAFGHGIGMLKMDSEVGNRIDDTLQSGAHVYACENTMRGRKLSKDDMLSKIGYVPAGVVEIINKQKEGWAVIRP